MLISRSVASLCLAGLTILGGTGVFGQSYPNKPLRFVTCGPVGGGADMVSRLVSQGITGPLGEPVIVDNRPCGVLTGEIVSAATPDGYTLLVSAGPLWLSPLLKTGVRYDPIKDFSAVQM